MTSLALMKIWRWTLTKTHLKCKRNTLCPLQFLPLHLLYRLSALKLQIVAQHLHRNRKQKLDVTGLETVNGTRGREKEFETWLVVHGSFGVIVQLL